MRRAFAYATSRTRTGFQRPLRLRSVPPIRLRVALPAASAICASAACAVVFTGALGGSGKQYPGERVGSSGNGSTRVGNLGAGMQAIGATPLDKALSTAAKSFGAPIILPDTAVVKPSDADSTAFLQWLPAPQPGVQEPVSQLNVSFSSANVGIEYAPTDLTYWGSHYPDALDQYKAEIAQSATRPPDLPPPPTYQIVYLSDGTPALAFTGDTGNGLEFRLGKLSITIWSPNEVLEGGVKVPARDPSTIQAIAQSIDDQASSAGS